MNGTADGKIVVGTEIDDTGFKKGMDDLQGVAKKKGGTLALSLATSIGSTITSILQTIGRAVTSILSASIRAITSIGRQAVAMASDIQEVQNVVDTAFGDLAYRMEDFAETAIETYGISKLVAKQTGSTFMSMARGMGLTANEASDMSLALTGLSADMASFYNVEQDVARIALNSVFTGETETLKRYGIVMSEINLNEFALSQGITKAYKNMTQAEKVQLRYNFVMQQTALAQGDFAKTSTSWANQTRILQENWKEFLSIVGNGLVQVLTPMLNTLNKIVGYMITLAETMSKVFGWAGQSDTQAQAGIMNEVAEATDEATQSTNALAKAQQGLSSFDELNVVGTSGGAGGGAGGIAGAMGSVDEVSKQSKVLDVFKNVLAKMGNIDFTNLINAFTRLKEAIEPYKKEFLENMQWLYENVLKPLGKWTLEEGLPTFIELIASALNALHPIVAKAYPKIKKLWKDVFIPIAKWNAEKLVEYLKQLTGFLDDITKAQNVKDVIKAIANAFNEWFKSLPIIQKVQGMYKNLYEDVKTYVHLMNVVVTDKINAIRTTVLNGVLSINNNVVSIISEIIDKIKGAIDSTVTKAKNGFDAITSGFANVYNSLHNTMNYILNLFTGVQSNISNGFVNAYNAIASVWNNAPTFFSSVYQKIQGVFGNVTGWFKSIWENAWNGIKNVFATGINNVNTIGNGVLTGLKNAINKLIDGINSVVTTPFNGLNTMLNNLKNIKIAGAKPFSFINAISVPKIPYLASGAVLPANNPFMAVVGDQRHGTNIEAPLDTIVEAMQIALKGQQQQVVFKVEGDPNGLFKVTQEQANNYTMRTGLPAF